VRGDGTIHLQKVTVARDYGDKIEISDGIRAGETIVASPTDATREGMKIEVAGPERSIK
jgi:multidrug efflux pump subunit AcrA (membrane-fusion protein)